MELIPAGTFQMGSDDDDARPDEYPVHTVHLDAFYMDIYPVTNAQYQKFLRAEPDWQKDRIDDDLIYDAPESNYLFDWDGLNYPPGRGNYPVTHVSWFAALAYAEWADKLLPSEAEWEYAARGGLAGQTYPWGNDITPYHANYDRHIGGTTAVGQYAANGYGLYDMVGNVHEWCFDTYEADFYAESRDNRNPVSFFKSFEHVARGGSWFDSASNLRVAARHRATPTYAVELVGFRCTDILDLES